MKFWHILLVTQIAFANPSGEVVKGGDVSFSRPQENQLQVLQKTERAVVEWERFSIDAGEVTQFIQPGADSVLLNKVMGGEISSIYGKLQANGQIILMNPQGVLMGDSGILDAPAFLTSQQDISASSFMDGAWNFTPSIGSAVINRNGQIEADSFKAIGGRLFLTSSSEETPFVEPYASQTENCLESLQELRTLIPERLWVQEFSLLIDRNAYQDQLNVLISHPRSEPLFNSSFALAENKDYLLRATMSGENIRMLDRYQEFEQSPFWRTPEMIERLDWMEDQ